MCIQVGRSGPRSSRWAAGSCATLAAMLLTMAPSYAAEGDSVTARGNEPGWSVTIGAGEIELLTNLGSDRATFPTPAAQADGDTTRYVIDSAGVTITLVDQPCADVMSGMFFPLTVTVEGATDEPLRGCGGESASLLVGDEWAVESIGGQPVLAGSTVTIAFDDEGHAFGSASCNRYFASWNLTGEGLTIGDAGSTMMACIEPGLSEQEGAFLGTLPTITGFEIGDDGALTLVDGGSPAIVARR